MANINQYLKVNAAPVAWGNRVFTSDTFHVTYDVGSPAGYFYSLDQSNGAVRWSFSGVDTQEFWGHPEINSGGGAWWPCSVDTQKGIIYWATKNPGNGSGTYGPYSGTNEYPNGSSRPGMNLYTNCLMAFDGKSGKLRWFTQLYAHDVFDHDTALPPILTTASIFGKDRDVAICSGKTGVIYCVSRDNGGIIWQTPVGKHQNDNLQILPDTPSVDLPRYLGRRGDADGGS